MPNSIMNSTTRSRMAFITLLPLLAFAAIVRGGSVVAPFQQPSFADSETSSNFAVPSSEE